MSNFLNKFKNENYQQDMDDNQQDTMDNQQEVESNTDPASFGSEFVNQSLADSINEGNKSEDEKSAEILMALNVSEAFDELDDEEDIATPAEDYEDLPEDDSMDLSESVFDESDDEDYTDNLSAAERAMRETEIIMPISSDSERDTESFDSTEVKRRHRSSPRPKIAPIDHEVVRDARHGKRKMTRFLVTALIILITVGAVFYFYWMNTQVEVPNLVGTTLAEQRNWALTNNITFEPTEEYSLEFAREVIMSQGNTPGSHIRPGSVLRVTVSLGPDPNERIELPNFYGLSTAEVREWIEENHLPSVNINLEYNDIIPEGRFIRKEFTVGGVTAENFTRQDGLLIFMSRGMEILPENIPVPNFVGRTLADVEEWARQHDIDVHVVEATSNTVPPESIISQNIEPRTLVARESDITITISLGPAVIVPDFSTMTAEEAAAFPGELLVIVRNRYHATIGYGELIYQSEEPGTELVGAGIEVEVYYSLGRPFLENLIGESESVIPEIFFDFTSHGADIVYYVIYVDSHLPRGQIVEMSKYNQWMEMVDYVNIWVSRGNLPPPPPPTPPATPPAN